jgi:hypothetical protein
MPQITALQDLQRRNKVNNTLTVNPTKTLPRSILVVNTAPDAIYKKSKMILLT